MDVKDFLCGISNTVGVSGFETDRALLIVEKFKEYCDEVKLDRHGNVIGLKKGRGKGKIMLAAHMDEIGLMVTHIDDGGFIKLTTLGGFDQRTLVAQEVIVHGKEKLFGVIGYKPQLISDAAELKKAPKLEELFVDTGYPADKIKGLVRVGDIVTVNRKAAELQKNRLSGKCMDDTAGLASFACALEYLKDVSLDADLYIVATAQEEIDCSGALTSAYTVDPDIALAVDVGFGRTAELKDEDSCELGKGPDISIGPNINRKVYNRLKDCAKNAGIAVQCSVLPQMSGTDAYALQIARTGIATAVISIPLKYMHTSVELLDIRDIRETGRLIAEFARSFNNCDMEDFLCY